MNFDFLNKMFKIDGLLDNAKGYIDAKIQMIKLEAQEKISKIVSTLLVIILVLFMSMMVLLFFTLALANYLNSLFDSSYIGFVILGLFFLLMVVLAALSKKFIYKLILSLTAEIMTKKEDK